MKIHPIDLQLADVQRDDQGYLREILHAPGQAFRAETDSPAQLLEAYFEQMQPHWKLPLDTASLPRLLAEIGNQDKPGTGIRLSAYKRNNDSTVAMIEQYHEGLPVWEAGMSVVMRRHPLAVIQASNRFDYRVGEVKPPRNGQYDPKEINEGFMQDWMVKIATDQMERHFFLRNFKHLLGRLKVHSVAQARQIVYRYEADKRIHIEQRGPHKDISTMMFEKFDVPLPPVPQEIREGGYYVVTDILYNAGIEGFIEPYHLRVFIEPETGAILFARVLIAHVNGEVYLKDPDTKGVPGLDGGSAASTLDALKDTVSLPGLNPPVGGAYHLEGNLVRLVDDSAPAVAAPSGPGPFNYSVPTDNFSAVNAYYHSDWVFRMLSADYGWNISTYMDGTAFPVKVDHRAAIGCGCADGNCKNAMAPGNALSNGSDGFRYALLDANKPVGIATDWRVVLHEFGHAILWDHVNSPNFGFCHSPGDSMAVILNDPGSLAADRFESFPWTGIGRRHDRAVSAGWAFRGTQADGGYGTEQILSTTLFRFYRLTGGDVTWSTPDQQEAAYWTVKLILDAVANLTPATNPATAEALCMKLVGADWALPSYRGVSGGHLHKVMRWSFEQQGAFSSATAPLPITTVGLPPAVDVFINDGRNGGYEPLQTVFWETTDIWNRRAPDGLLLHEHPVVGTPNHVYVRIGNRGTQTANNVRVRVYRSNPGSGLVWPMDWTPVTIGTLTLSTPLNPGATAVVGPFTWTATQLGHQCLLAIVDHPQDMAIDATANGPLPCHRLVPFDNNIAQRNVYPVAMRSIKEMVDSFDHCRIDVRNPFDRERPLRMEVVYDEASKQLGFELEVKGLRANALLTLKPQEKRTFELLLKVPPPKDKLEAFVRRKAKARVQVRAYLDQTLLGGMTYELDPAFKGDPGGPPKDQCQGRFGWLRCLFKRLFKFFSRR